MALLLSTVIDGVMLSSLTIHFFASMPFTIDCMKMMSDIGIECKTQDFLL